MKYKIEFDIMRWTDSGGKDLIDLLSDPDCAFKSIEPFIGILWHVDAVPNHKNDNVWSITAETDDANKKRGLISALRDCCYGDVVLNGKYV